MLSTCHILHSRLASSPCRRSRVGPGSSDPGLAPRPEIAPLLPPVPAEAHALACALPLRARSVPGHRPAPPCHRLSPHGRHPAKARRWPGPVESVPPAQSREIPGSETPLESDTSVPPLQRRSASKDFTDGGSGCIGPGLPSNDGRQAPMQGRSASGLLVLQGPADRGAAGVRMHPAAGHAPAAGRRAWHAPSPHSLVPRAEDAASDAGQGRRDSTRAMICASFPLPV